MTVRIRRYWRQRRDTVERRRAAVFWAGLVTLIGLAVLWWQAPSFYGSNAEGRSGAIATTRTGILTVAAGLIAFIGVTLNLAETRRANRETERREWLAASTDRYSKAIEQLGSDKPSIRLGGVHLFESLWETDQPVVVGVLSDFVVQQADPLIRLHEAEPDHEALKAPAGERRRLAASALAGRPLPGDVQAALALLGRLRRMDGVSRGELAGAYLSTARLSGADLSGADLSGADLSGADLRGADLSRANLTRALLHGAELSGAQFSEADLIEARLEGLDLTEAHLEGADLTEAHLEGANLTEAHLEGANLTEAHLEGANLTEAHLEGANLTRARLTWGTRLTGAHLDWANLTKAHLEGRNLFGVSLREADLSGADLRAVQGLTQGQLDSARGDAQTQLPPDYRRPSAWST